jgi:hypothetical protein
VDEVWLDLRLDRSALIDAAAELEAELAAIEA